MFENRNINKSARKLYATGVVMPWILIAIAYYYFQLELGLAPCPLCMFQRAALAVMSFVCLFALLLSFRSSAGMLLYKTTSALIALAAIVGISIAGRQVWLQHLPPEKVPACGIDPVYAWLEMSNYSFMDMLRTTLHGSGDCSEVDWSLLGMSIAGWMIVIFSSILMFALAALFRKR